MDTAILLETMPKMNNVHACLIEVYATDILVAYLVQHVSMIEWPLVLSANGCSQNSF